MLVRLLSAALSCAMLLSVAPVSAVASPLSSLEVGATSRGLPASVLRRRLAPHIIHESDILLPAHLTHEPHTHEELKVTKKLRSERGEFVKAPWPYSHAELPCTTYARQDNCVGNPPLRPDALPACAGFAGPVPSNVTLFGIIGDYGLDGNCLSQVAALVDKVQKQFGQLEFIMTTGDNAYWTGSCSSLESSVAQYYSSFLPTNGTEPCTDPMQAPKRGYVNPHWSDMKHFNEMQSELKEAERAVKGHTDESSASASKPHPSPVGRKDSYPVRFFPALGNHDWSTFAADPVHMPYFQFFDYLLDYPPSDLAHGQFYQALTSIPGVELFSLNSNLGAPDATPLQQDLFAEQVSWLQSALGNSSAPFKIVYFHHPPFCTAQHDALAPWMDLDYEDWGASAVIVGHEHVYERMLINRPLRDGSAPAMPYIVNGLGGHPWSVHVLAAGKRAAVGCLPLLAFARVAMRVGLTLPPVVSVSVVSLCLASSGPTASQVAPSTPVRNSNTTPTTACSLLSCLGTPWRNNRRWMCASTRSRMGGP